jgi:hypothetical protein
VNVIPPFGERPNLQITRCADCGRPELVTAEPKKLSQAND